MDSPIFTLFWLLSSLSLVSFGGIAAILPDLQREVVQHYQWMTPIEFVHALTLVQIAPGPNLLFGSLIGWRVAGLPGLLGATLAIIGPTSLMALVAGRLFMRYSSLAWVNALKNAMAPLVLGFSFATFWVIAQQVDRSYLPVFITLFVASFVTLTSYNPLWGFLAGLGLTFLGQLF